MFRAITFLGTSSGTPTATRNVSSYCLSFTSGLSFLVDAGEGTQHQILRCKDVSLGKIQRIFITHMHGDHCFGLPGLMCSLSLLWNPPKGSNETDRHSRFNEDMQFLEIYGPPGLGNFVRTALTTSESHFGFQYRIHEVVPKGCEPPAVDTLHEDEAPPVLIPQLDDGSFPILDADNEDVISVRGVPLDHRVFCVGYVVREANSPGKLDMKKATDLGVPKGPLLSDLKAGKVIRFATKDGEKEVKPEEVVGPTIAGRRALLLGDTCNSDATIPFASGAEVVVHEATFDDAHAELAEPRGHSTARMAGQFAQKLGAKSLILTHFSARYPSVQSDPEPINGLLKQAKEEFSGAAFAADDFSTFDLSRKKL